MSPVIAQHLAKTVEHGTPKAIVEMARDVMGSIECDPCSSEYWNTHLVNARAWFGADHSPLANELTGGFKSYFINPPGGLVKDFWDFATRRWCEGAAVFWVGFSLEQMTYLQSRGLMYAALRRCILPKRLAFMKRVEGGPPVASKQPTHGNYLCLMPRLNEQVDRFDEHCKSLGAVAF